jgi:hypothetical protein
MQAGTQTPGERTPIQTMETKDPLKQLADVVETMLLVPASKKIAHSTVMTSLYRMYRTLSYANTDDPATQSIRKKLVEAIDHSPESTTGALFGSLCQAAWESAEMTVAGDRHMTVMDVRSLFAKGTDEESRAALIDFFTAITTSKANADDDGIAGFYAQKALDPIRADWNEYGARSTAWLFHMACLALQVDLGNANPLSSNLTFRVWRDTTAIEFARPTYQGLNSTTVLEPSNTIKSPSKVDKRVVTTCPSILKSGKRKGLPCNRPTESCNFHNRS